MRKFSEHFAYKYAVDIEELTIEHIHPQSQTSEVWTENLIGSFGNLMFLEGDANEKIGTKSFKEKIEYLTKHGHAVPEFVREREKWTQKAVESHSEYLAELAYNEVWKI